MQDLSSGMPVIAILRSDGNLGPRPKAYTKCDGSNFGPRLKSDTNCTGILCPQPKSATNCNGFLGTQPNAYTNRNGFFIHDSKLYKL